MGNHEKIKVLIVDDNRNYREAFKRMLLMQDYDVCEAEDSDNALEVYRSEHPDVMVTDLWMRTKDEGLELIRRIKDINPAYPVVMISAVGTFETGARASRLGATYVISKSRIEEEMHTFLETIDRAHRNYREAKEQLAFIRHARNNEITEAELSGVKERLRTILTNAEEDSYLKGEAYDALLQISEMEMREMSERTIDNIAAGEPREEIFKQIYPILARELPEIESLDKDSLESLRSAELLYQEQEKSHLGVDFSRSIGFSYCFAVENEVKVRLRKKLLRLFSNPETYKHIDRMLDKRLDNLDLFFHQYILRLQQQDSFEFTTDNVKQTLTRIKQFEQCYKPDGLKALGIVILCFGRTYTSKSSSGAIEVNNPLALKGLEEGEKIEFAQELVLLQHFRNPYIHPEISEMEQLSRIRETAFSCLRRICRLV